MIIKIFAITVVIFCLYAETRGQEGLPCSITMPMKYGRYGEPACVQINCTYKPKFFGAEMKLYNADTLAYTYYRPSRNVKANQTVEGFFKYAIPNYSPKNICIIINLLSSMDFLVTILSKPIDPKAKDEPDLYRFCFRLYRGVIDCYEDSYYIEGIKMEKEYDPETLCFVFFNPLNAKSGPVCITINCKIYPYTFVRWLEVYEEFTPVYVTYLRTPTVLRKIDILANFRHRIYKKPDMPYNELCFKDVNANTLYTIYFETFYSKRSATYSRLLSVKACFKFYQENDYQYYPGNMGGNAKCGSAPTASTTSTTTTTPSTISYLNDSTKLYATRYLNIPTTYQPMCVQAIYTLRLGHYVVVLALVIDNFDSIEKIYNYTKNTYVESASQRFWPHPYLGDIQSTIDKFYVVCFSRLSPRVVSTAYQWRLTSNLMIQTETDEASHILKNFMIFPLKPPIGEDAEEQQVSGQECINSQYFGYVWIFTMLFFYNTKCFYIIDFGC